MSKTAAKTSSKSAHGGAKRAPKAHRISHELRVMAAEVRDLRTLRTKYEKLLTEHNGLLGALRDLSSELASGARAAWNDYRRTGRGTGGGPGRPVTRRIVAEALPAAGWPGRACV